jgi:hypothetical protein
VNIKVRDLATLYNLDKADCELDSNRERNSNANFECQPVLLNSESCLCNQFLKLFHSKFGMPFYMKVVSLLKMDNFHKGRILSV